MVKYSEKDIEHSNMLKCRFILLDLINQSEDNSYMLYKNRISLSSDNIFDWVLIKRELKNLLKYYDDGNKINEDFLLSLKNIKLTNKPILVKRLIKLMKIV